MKCKYCDYPKKSIYWKYCPMCGKETEIEEKYYMIKKEEY